MLTGKISYVEFKKTWGKAPNLVYYHDVWFEGSEQKWNIGAKKENPDYLSVGSSIDYEITDEKMHKIKRIQKKLDNSSKIERPKAAAPVTESTSLIRNLDNYNESDLLFIDIETVRGVKELQPGTPLWDAWEYKNRYNNELERKSGETVTMEEYFKEKAALYASFAKVITIVVGKIVDGNKLKIKTYSANKTNKWSEEVILREFNDDIKTFLDKNNNIVFAGWANFTFDQPFLNKRMLTYGIQPNILLDTNHLKPWEISGIDLKVQWQGSSFYPDSMIAAAVAMGLPSPKSKMDGSEVGEYYYAGKIDDIVTYCVGDVLTSANLYRKFVNRPLLTLL